MLVFWAMVNVHVDLLIGMLYNKTANSSDILKCGKDGWWLTNEMEE